MAVVGLMAALAAGPIVSLVRPISVPAIVQLAIVQPLASSTRITIPRLHTFHASVAARRKPSRNPFSFAAAPSVVATHAAPAPVAVSTDSATSPEVSSPLQLIGMAEEADGGRTAIIRTREGLEFVEVGERVTTRYRVMTVASDSVALVNIESGRILTFTHVGEKVEVADAGESTPASAR